MRIIESCAECLYDRQKAVSNDENYLKEIKIVNAKGLVVTKIILY